MSDLTDQPDRSSESTLTETITQDVACSHCGYNLHGLPAEGRCPECGTPVEQSEHGELLKYADPAWVKKLRQGAQLMLWNIVITLLMGCSQGVLAGGSLSGLALLPVIVASALSLWATFLITSQDPRAALQEDPVSLRRFVRIAAVMYLIGNILEAVTEIAPHAWIAGVAGVLTLLGIAHFFGFFVYLRRLAMRIPDEPLAKSTKTVMWGFCIALILFVIVGGLAVLFAAGAGTTTTISGPGFKTTATGTGQGQGMTVGVGILLGVGCAGSVLLLVFGIWWLILLFKYHAVFKKAAEEASLRTASREAGLSPQ